MDGNRVGLYKAQGIVLRSMKLGEADRIVTIFTQTHGRVRGVAKGIRKSSSRFGGRLDAFTHVDLMLYHGRGDLDTITQADIIARRRRLREDYAAFCAASAMAEAVERTTPEREPNVRLFLLLRSALEAVEDRAADPSTLAYAFLAKLASMAGLHPALAACVECGGAGRAGFSFERGGVVCAQCVERTDPRISDQAAEAWSAFIGAEWSELGASEPSLNVQRDVAGLLLAFVQWHTESRLRAFALLGTSAAS